MEKLIACKILYHGLAVGRMGFQLSNIIWFLTGGGKGGLKAASKDCYNGKKEASVVYTCESVKLHHLLIATKRLKRFGKKVLITKIFVGEKINANKKITNQNQAFCFYHNKTPKLNLYKKIVKL